jgi:hypothetical protein
MTSDDILIMDSTVATYLIAVTVERARARAGARQLPIAPREAPKMRARHSNIPLMVGQRPSPRAHATNTFVKKIN